MNWDNLLTKGQFIKSLKLENKETEIIPDKYIQELIKLENLEIKIIFDNRKNEGELLKNLKKEQDKLMKSIERREKLLSNENYLKKAPSNIVETEKEMVRKEKEQLELINEKLK